MMRIWRVLGPQAKLVIIDNGDCGRFDDNDDDDDNAKGMLKHVASCHNDEDFEGGESSRQTGHN